MCLDIHLIPSKDLFLKSTTFSENYDISSAAFGLVQLFESCYNQYVLFRETEHLWRLDSVKQVCI